MDTPIADRDVVDDLLKHVLEVRPFKAENDLTERHERTEKFLEYLRKQEEEEFQLRPEYIDGDLTKKQYMPEIIKAYEEEKAYITSKREIQASLYANERKNA